MAPLIADIYRPDTEHWSHYSETILPRQFDASLALRDRGGHSDARCGCFTEAGCGTRDLPFGLCITFRFRADSAQIVVNRTFHPVDKSPRMPVRNSSPDKV